MNFVLKIKKYIAGIFFVTTLFVGSTSFVPEAKAGAWGEAMFAMLSDNVLDNISRKIEGAILGSLKVAAIQMLNSQVTQLVGGGAGGKALFITDWNKFLHETPRQKTDVFMNDFFTLSTRGKFSSANYVPVGGGNGMSENYASYLVKQAKENLESTSQVPQYNLDQYVGNPGQLFREGDWRGFNAFFANTGNNPFGYAITSQNVYQEKLKKEEKNVQIQAQSSGFIGQEKNGVVTTPAGSIQAMVTDVQTLGNKLVVNAQNPAEYLSGVVQSVVNSTINKVIKTGVGEAQKAIRKEVNNINKEIADSIKEATKVSGPAIKFNSSLGQRINVNLNTKTPPPPTPVNALTFTKDE